MNYQNLEFKTFSVCAFGIISSFLIEISFSAPKSTTTTPAPESEENVTEPTLPPIWAPSQLAEWNMKKWREIRLLSPYEPIKEKEAKATKVCYTTDCLDSALHILRQMNFGVKPCDDFYEFVCGAKTNLDDDARQWTGDEIAQDILIAWPPPSLANPGGLNLAKMFYRSCTNQAHREWMGLRPLVSLLGRYGDWPVAIKNWNATLFNVTKLLATISSDLDIPTPIVQVNVDRDPQDSSRNIIHLDQPKFILPCHVHLNPEDENSIRLFQAAINYFVGLAKHIAMAANIKVNFKELPREAKRALEFEAELVHISSSPENRRLGRNLYNTKPLEEFEEDVPFNWPRLLQLIFDRIGVQIEENEELNVVEPTYFESLMEILERTERRTIANYILFHVVSSFATDTTDPLWDLHFQFQMAHKGYSKQSHGMDYCTEITKKYFGLAILSKFYSSGDKTAQSDLLYKMNVMTERIQRSFHVMFGQLKWMDQNSKVNAQVKLTQMKKFYLYPDWVDNTQVISDYFNGLHISPNDYFGSLLTIQRWIKLKEFNTLRRKPERNLWLHPSTYSKEVNYYTNQNAYVITRENLKAKPFKKNGMELINFAGMGLTIANSIARAFDDDGIDWDGNGNLFNLLKSKGSKKTFERKIQLISQRYENSTVRISGWKNQDRKKLLTYNGALAVGATISSDTALEMTYKAYLNLMEDYSIIDHSKSRQEGIKLMIRSSGRLAGFEAMTIDKLFFVAYASHFCDSKMSPEQMQSKFLSETPQDFPKKFMILGNMKNSKEFQDAWECPPGTHMNDGSRRRVVWA